MLTIEAFLDDLRKHVVYQVSVSRSQLDVCLDMPLLFLLLLEDLVVFYFGDVVGLLCYFCRLLLIDVLLNLFNWSYNDFLFSF